MSSNACYWSCVYLIIKSFNCFLCPVLSCIMAPPRFEPVWGVVVAYKTPGPVLLGGVRSLAIGQSTSFKKPDWVSYTLDYLSVTMHFI